MTKPLTRAQQLENRAFVRQLRKTGNASTAAAALGFGRGRFDYRRKQHPAFATRWDVALALAHAALADTRGSGPAPSGPPSEPRIRHLRTGRLQLRRATAGHIDHAGRQRFLAALSATANVALSAKAAGFTRPTLYRHRQLNPGFAREWRLALEMGYERLELALLESGLPESFADDDWRRNDPPAVPPMTVNQALQLLYLHQKEARLGGTPEHLGRRRPGETRAAQNERLTLLGEHRIERDRLNFRIREAERLARGEPTYVDWEAEGNPLPDLSQVTGWSKATGKPATDPDRALFGGWRIKDIPEEKRRR